MTDADRQEDGAQSKPLWEVAKAAYIAGPDNARDHRDLWQFVVDAILAALSQPAAQSEREQS